jgi:predicted cupin superfamily sugar epimerase
VTRGPRRTRRVGPLPPAPSADELIERFALVSHPEGGWYRELWRDEPAAGGRGAGSAILFLLRSDERSHWHRVDATEIWHHSAGGPLTLAISMDGSTIVQHRLGDDLVGGEQAIVVVPAGAWQAAWPHDGWVLVGCTVAPAFEFDGFELAPPGWVPPQRREPAEG